MFSYSDIDNPIPGIELALPAFPPPQPIIINHGNGIYDTVWVSNQTHEPTPDQLLLGRARNRNYLEIMLMQ